MDLTKLYLGAVLFAGLERLFELWLSGRNAAWSFSRGGIEAGREHWLAMRALHTLWLVACVAEPIGLVRQTTPPLMAASGTLFVLAEFLRYWAVRTLGPHWNTRVIVVPGSVAVRGGPYRFFRHPNYVAVAIEGIALPMMHNAFLTAIAFTCLNALVLQKRIRSEEALLRGHVCEYERVGSASTGPA